MMSLQFGKVDFQKQNKSLSKNTIEFINKIFKYFEEQIRYILLHSFYSTESL